MSIKTTSIQLLHKESIHKGGIYKLIAGKYSIYSTGADGVVLKWSLDLQKCELICKTNIPNYTMEVHNQLLCIGSSNGFVTVVDLEKRELVAQKKMTPKSVFSLALQEQTLYIGTENGDLIKASLDLSNSEVKKITTKSIRSIALFKKMLAVGCSDNNIYLLNNNLEIFNEIVAHQSSVFAVQFLNESELISGGRDAKLIRTNLETLETRIIDAHVNTINDVIFSPDHQFFLTSSRDKSFKVWSSDSLRLLKVINSKKERKLPPYSINSSVWVADKIYTASDSGALICWQFSNI